MVPCLICSKSVKFLSTKEYTLTAMWKKFSILLNSCIGTPLKCLGGNFLAHCIYKCLAFSIGRFKRKLIHRNKQRPSNFLRLSDVSKLSNVFILLKRIGISLILNPNVLFFNEAK